MKRLLTALLLLCLCGCGNAASVGIIGGADGPTSILVANRAEDEIITPIRMINADGNLYFDTGESSATPRCGNLDGGLEKSAEQWEIPHTSGGANFSIGNEYFGYQSTSSLSKEVPIDGEWVVFKKIDSHGADLSHFKYCFYIKGMHPNAARESEYVVLSNSLDVKFENITDYFFSSQFEDHLQDIVVINYDIADEWGILFYVENPAPDGAVLKFQQFGKASGELQTGEWYRIERLEDGDGKPVDKKIADDELAWNMLAYPIKKNDETELVINWEGLYGELPPGDYRLIKEIMQIHAPGDYDKKLYECYFTIE